MRSHIISVCDCRRKAAILKASSSQNCASLFPCVVAAVFPMSPRSLYYGVFMFFACAPQLKRLYIKAAVHHAAQLRPLQPAGQLRDPSAALTSNQKRPDQRRRRFCSDSLLRPSFLPLISRVLIRTISYAMKQEGASGFAAEPFAQMEGL